MSNDHSHPGPDPVPKAAAPAPEAAPTPPPAAEDAGALALAEALRSSFKIVKFLMVALLVAFFASGIFTVKPNQIAIKLRFGSPVGDGAERLLKPGLHWKFPYPIDEIVYVPVGESRTVMSTAGWYYLTPEQEASGQEPEKNPSLRPGVDGYTLTGDGNIIHARVILSYRITDPISYEFGFGNATNLLQHVLDNALIYASARFTADDALYRNKLAFQETVLERVNRLVGKLNLGIAIEPREVRAVAPPSVADAFDNVVKAQQQGDIKIQEAEGYARGATNRAAGEANLTVRDGMTRSNYLVQTVAAEARSFNDLLPRYQSNRELFQQRLLTDTMQRVLTNAQFKVFLPQRADGKTRELRLQLNKEPELPGKDANRK